MKKFISFMLSIILMISVMFVPVFSISAVTLDDSKIYIHVDSDYYEVNTGDIFTYAYLVKYDDAKIGSLDIRITYDSEGLKFVPDVDEYGDYVKETMFPIMKSPVIVNFKNAGIIKFNYASTTGVWFNTDDSQAFCGKFLVTAEKPGVYDIDGYIETLADYKMNKIVYVQEKYLDYSEGKTILDLEPVKDPSPTDDTSDMTTPATIPPSEYPPTSGPSEPLPDDDPTEPLPSEEPTDPSEEPSVEPTEPTTDDVIVPTGPEGTAPSEPQPSTDDPSKPTDEPTDEPIVDPTEAPTDPTQPSEEPTDDPIIGPTQPSEEPTVDPSDPSDPQRMLGDVNGDGQVSVLDATQIQFYVAKKVNLTDIELQVADVNGDGQVSVLDATQIQLYVAKKVPTLKPDI